MKQLLRLISFAMMEIFVVIFVYPFLHETGHAISALYVGVDLFEFRILPHPYIECDISSASEMTQCVIGVSGMLFPFIVSCVIRKRNFWLWLLSMNIKGISLLSFFISYVALLCYASGFVWEGEDIVKVAEVCSQSWLLWLLIVLLLACICCVNIVNHHPIKRITSYLDV